jgi:hypothetical protein
MNFSIKFRDSKKCLFRPIYPLRLMTGGS